MNQIALDLQPASPDYRTIPLSKGQFAIVDIDDYEWLSQWKWYAKWNKPTQSFYAARSSYETGAAKTIRMHRQILDIDSDLRVDHRDHDTLNNRRGNLRPATYAQNNQNASLRKDSSSGVRGVDFHKGSQKWRARIAFNGNKITLGVFEKLDDAKAAYADAARTHHGEFASIQERKI